jgi:outer membrane protein OmpA-like peptidoglycan-associated protein
VELPEGVEPRIGPKRVTLEISDSVLHFELDSATPADPVAARQLAAALVAATADYGPRWNIRVTGFSSADGPTAEYDRDLSYRRARTVCDLLIAAGIAATRLTCIGSGRDDDRSPAGPGPEDRRVVIVLTRSKR